MKSIPLYLALLLVACTAEKAEWVYEQPKRPHRQCVICHSVKTSTKEGCPPITIETTYELCVGRDIKSWSDIAKWQDSLTYSFVDQFGYHVTEETKCN